MDVNRNTYSVLFSYPSLGYLLWGFLNNHTQPLGERVESGFFQPIRPDTAHFEFPQAVKDDIILVLVLLCLICMACTEYVLLGARTVVRVVQHPQEEEEKRSKSAGTMSAQTLTDRKGTKRTISISTRTSMSKESLSQQPLHPSRRRNQRVNQST